MKLWLWLVGYFTIAYTCGVPVLIMIIAPLVGFAIISIVFMMCMFAKVIKEMWQEREWDKAWTRAQQHANIEFVNKICKVNEDT